jgi:hypothetical protein
MYRPPIIREDLANHYIYTQLISAVIYVCLIPFLPQIAAWAAFMIGVIFAVVWEYIQRKTKSGTFSMRDAFAGSIGSAIFLFIVSSPLLINSLNI